MKRRYYRLNSKITAPQVRVIGKDEKQIGLMPTRDAIKLAQEARLDLIEVSPDANPPVCKILDFRKFFDEQKDKDRHAERRSRAGTKELRIRPNIGENDLRIRIKRTREFLESDHQVRLSMLFRGREITHREVGEEKLSTVVASTADIGKVASGPSLRGHILFLILAPK